MNFGLVAWLPAQWPVVTAAVKKVAPAMLGLMARTETPTSELAALFPRLAPALFGVVASGQAQPLAQALTVEITTQLAVEGQARARHKSASRGSTTSMIVEIADDEATNFAGEFLVDNYNREDCNMGLSTSSADESNTSASMAGQGVVTFAQVVTWQEYDRTETAHAVMQYSIPRKLR
jgi:hypothetical protein